MKDKAELTGWINIRPARIGLALQPQLSTLREAARGATHSWGGLYFPMLRSDDYEGSLRFAAQLDVDAIYPMDTDDESARLAAEVGYVWQGRGDWGPFHQGDSRLGRQLHHPQWISDELGDDAGLFALTWADDDPLAVLFALWFGVTAPALFRFGMFCPC